MRKILFYFLFAGFFVSLAFATRISSVRLEPQKNNYSAGERIKVFWSYSQNSPSDKVRITIRKAGRDKALCILADFVDITEGSSGKTVVLNSPCRDAAGQNNDITEQDVWIRVQLKGQARTVYADSSHFTIKKFSVENVSSFKFLSKEETLSNIANRIKTNEVRLTDFRLLPYKKYKGIYRLSWKFIGPSFPKQRPLLKLYRNGAYFCTIRRVNPPEGFIDLNFKSPTPLCRDKKFLPNDPTPTYQFFFDYSDYTNRESILTPRMKLPLFPELRITKIKISERRNHPHFSVFITVWNSGPAEAGPFILKVWGRDCQGRTFYREERINKNTLPGNRITYIIRVPRDHFNYWCCTIDALIDHQGDIKTTNGYTEERFSYTQRFTPPHITGHM